MCKREARILPPLDELQPDQGLNIEMFGIAPPQTTLRLLAMSDVTGINALGPKKPLTFDGQHVSVIYGTNGVGKSGYTRILKHSCGARFHGSLLQDISGEVAVQQKCKITYRQDEVESNLDWEPGTGVHNDLREISVYDTEEARFYITADNELTFEPGLLRVLSNLSDVSDRLRDRFINEVATNVSHKPAMPASFAQTSSANWYAAMTAKTKNIPTACNWSAEDEKALADLRARLAETNPADKARNVRKHKTNLETLVLALESDVKNISAEQLKELLQLKDKKEKARKAADEYASKVFAGAPLDGVATDTWKVLWEAARSFSESEAYPTHTFPHTDEDAHCVLCQQTLDTNGRERLKSFESYVKGHLESAAKNEEKILIERFSVLDSFVGLDELPDRLDLCGLDDEITSEQCKTLVACLHDRRNNFLTSYIVNEESIDVNVIDVLKALIAGKEATAHTYEDDAKAENRPESLLKFNELSAKKWLSEQKQAIEDELERLKKIALLDKAQSLTNTKALTTKKTELSEHLVTQAFIDRFQAELDALGASHINVTLEQKKGAKGRVKYQVKIRNNRTSAKTAEILSEGEFRIVSIAAFLADVTGSESRAPIVFDDPISSLDMDFEEAVVDRLVTLSADRQVIVFTHRISLMVMLEDACEAKDLEISVSSLRREAWGAGDPGGPPVMSQRCDKALNGLLARLTEASKARKEQGEDVYRVLFKALSGDIRITVEKLIESDLFNDVIHRFRRGLKTMGKLRKLSVITLNDCLLLEEMMTKYSRYEHAQPQESPGKVMEPEKIREDLEKLANWRKEFTARNASSSRPAQEP